MFPPVQKVLQLCRWALFRIAAVLLYAGCVAVKLPYKRAGAGGCTCRPADQEARPFTHRRLGVFRQSGVLLLCGRRTFLYAGEGGAITGRKRDDTFYIFDRFILFFSDFFVRIRIGCECLRKQHNSGFFQGMGRNPQWMRFMCVHAHEGKRILKRKFK